MRVWPVAAAMTVGGRVEITGPDARHIAQVLRLVEGDVLKVSDADSQLFEARIETVKTTRITAQVIKKISAPKVKKPEVTIAVSLSKQSVMEIVVQKAVELGCNRFVPVVTDRSLLKQMTHSKVSRLRRIAHEACKQCGTVQQMTVSDPVVVDGLPDAELKIVLWESEKGKELKSLLSENEKVSTLLLMVGPPGGFDKKEVERFRKNGFVTAGLGGLIVRTETAAISLMAVVNYHFNRV